MKSCQQCGADLNHLEMDVPCPNCASTSRNVAVTAVCAVGVMSRAEVGLQMIRSQHQPWDQMWREMMSELETLRAACKPNARVIDSVQVDSAVDTFFIDCEHLREWMAHDIASLNGIVEADLKAVYDAEPDLQLCTDICNTKKHHTRDRASAVAAGIRTTTKGSDGSWSVELEYGVPGQTQQTRDALDLAESCSTIWRGYLRSRGVTVP